MRLKNLRAVSIASLTFFLCASAIGADDGIVTKPNYSVQESMDRLESTAKAKGMTIFARIDLSARW
jgi:hypothetical protein